MTAEWMAIDDLRKVALDRRKDGIDHPRLQCEHDVNLHRFVVGWVHPRSFSGLHNDRWMPFSGQDFSAYRRAL